MNTFLTAKRAKAGPKDAREYNMVFASFAVKLLRTYTESTENTQSAQSF